MKNGNKPVNFEHKRKEQKMKKSFSIFEEACM